MHMYRCCVKCWTTCISWRLEGRGGVLPMWGSGGWGGSLWDLCCLSSAPLPKALQRYVRLQCQLIGY